MKKPVMFWLTEEQKERLVKTAQYQGRTISEIMRRSIDALIAREGPSQQEISSENSYSPLPKKHPE